MREREAGTIAQDSPDREKQPAYVPGEKEVLAVQTLEGIRCVLENGQLGNEDCCRRIEHLIRLYYRELGVKVVCFDGPD